MPIFLRNIFIWWTVVDGDESSYQNSVPRIELSISLETGQVIISTIVHFFGNSLPAYLSVIHLIFFNWTYLKVGSVITYSSFSLRISVVVASHIGNFFEDSFGFAFQNVRPYFRNYISAMQWQFLWNFLISLYFNLFHRKPASSVHF